MMGFDIALDSVGLRTRAVGRRFSSASAAELRGAMSPAHRPDARSLASAPLRHARDPQPPRCVLGMCQTACPDLTTVVCDCVLQDSGHGAHAHPEGAGARPNTSPLTPSSIAAEIDASREALDACDAVPLLAAAARWEVPLLGDAAGRRMAGGGRVRPQDAARARDQSRSGQRQRVGRRRGRLGCPVVVR